MNEHYRKARWFQENRGVTRYRLVLLALQNKVRSRKEGQAKSSPRTWCVEDYDEHVEADRRLARKAARA